MSLKALSLPTAKASGGNISLDLEHCSWGRCLMHLPPWRVTQVSRLRRLLHLSRAHS
jgi:hypothetical protein